MGRTSRNRLGGQPRTGALGILRGWENELRKKRATGGQEQMVRVEQKRGNQKPKKGVGLEKNKHLDANYLSTSKRGKVQ